MRAFWRLFRVDCLLYLREPIATFFTLLFAPLMLVLFGSIYGNQPSALFNGRGTVDISIPAYISLVVASVALMSLPISVASLREKGVLRRFHITPLRPLTYFLADTLVYLLMILLGITLLVCTGLAFYGVHLPAGLGSVFLASLLGSSAFLALGYVLASLVRTARTAQVVGMAVTYPLIFLSGAGIPLEIFPKGMQQFARFLPLNWLVTLTKGLWLGDSWGAHWLEVLLLAGLLVLCTILAVALFRWE
jgi:ABC-2 type transport system permease protein